uniref:MerR family transcriptional regulator n=1 Tax=uncultured Mitsuokella sp. TaxID=453120 RepID=UPI00265CCB08
MKLISIGTFAREVGLTPTTLRRMHKTGDLVPTYVSKGGTRYYSAEQLKKFSHQESQSNLVIGYCRVSTPAQKDDLEKQVENVKAYMYAKGYEFEIIRDIGSGINQQFTAFKPLAHRPKPMLA